jgi:cytochrome c-type biogenesis protein CcmH/NrfG
MGIVFSAWKLERTEAPPAGQPPMAKEQEGHEQLRKRVASLEKMLSVSPNDIKALVQLGNDYFDLRNYEHAIEAYQKVLKIDPKNADVLTDLGIAYRRTGKPQDAVRVFRSALEVDPDHAMALFNLGIVLRDDLKDDSGALKAWETFLEKAGDTPHAVMVRPWVEQLRAKMAESHKGEAPKK